MDASINASKGTASGIISIFLGINSAFSPENIDLTMKIVLFFASIITAVMAWRYYALGIKEKRQEIEKNEHEREENEKTV